MRASVADVCRRSYSRMSGNPFRKIGLKYFLTKYSWSIGSPRAVVKMRSANASFHCDQMRSESETHLTFAARLPVKSAHRVSPDARYGAIP